MKKITENELLEKVSKLREYIAVVESEQVNEVNWGALGTGALNAVKTGAQKFFGSTAGKVATGAAAGAGALAAGQALTKPGQAAAPKGTTAKVPGKSDPAVKALQDKLIAAGAKIKADGIMGPATAAAQAQFPQAAAGTPAPAAAPLAGAPGAQDDATGVDAAVAAQQAGAAPVTSMDDSDDVNAQAFVPPTATPGTPPPPAVGTAPAAAAPVATAAPTPMPGGYGSGAKPAAAPTKAQQLVTQAGLPQPGASAEDMLKNMQALPGMDPQKMMADQQARMAAMKAKTAAAAGAAAPAAAPTATPGTPPPAPVGESTSFKNDELNRIVSLVRYR